MRHHPAHLLEQAAASQFPEGTEAHVVQAAAALLAATNAGRELLRLAAIGDEWEAFIERHADRAIGEVMRMAELGRATIALVAAAAPTEATDLACTYQPPWETPCGLPATDPVHASPRGRLEPGQHTYRNHGR